MTQIIPADRISDIRKKLGLTIEEAASRCGIRYATWWAWENGASEPTRFAAVLELLRMQRESGED